MYDSSCRACGLWAGKATVCVPGEGDIDSRLLILGQAPGDTEDREGRPFVGRAGALLRSALQEARILSAWIDNPVRCYPVGHEVPTKEQLAACRIYTERVVAAMRRLAVIVTLGNVALGEVTGRPHGILSRAGIPERATYLGRYVTVFPCLHPAHVLRSPGMLAKFQGDLGALRKVLDQESTVVPFRLAGGREGAEILARAGQATVPVAFDLETTGLDPSRGSILRASVSWGEETYSIRMDEPEAVQALREFCQSSAPKVVQNLDMELGWAECHLGVPLRNVVADTRILGKREDEERPASLAVLASVHVPETLGFKLDSEAALEGGERYWEQPDHLLGPRNALDAYSTGKLRERLLRVLPPDAEKWHREVDLPIATAIHRMGRRGLAFDRIGMLNVREVYLARAREAERAFRNLGFASKMASPQQLREEFEKYGINTGQKTKTGEMSTDDSALKAVIRMVTESGDPKLSWAKEACQAVLAYRAAQTIIQRYIIGFLPHLHPPRGRGTIGGGESTGIGIARGHWLYPGTETWRASCSSPNLQNIPRGDKGPYRSCVVSRYGEGYLVEVDYSQVELRILAALSGDRTMGKIYREGGDIHGTTAAGIWGTGYTKKDRTNAKPVTFGVVYGGDDLTLQEQLEKEGIYYTRKECKKFLQVFRSLYPEATGYMDSLRERCVESPLVEAPSFGLRRHLLPSEARGIGHMGKAGANFPIQCAAGVMTLLSIARLENVLDEGTGQVVVCGHDAVLADCPSEEAARSTGLRIREAMLQVAEEQPWLTVPMDAEIKVGKNWLEMEEVPCRKA